MNDETIDLLARWRSGDETAAADLFQLYASRLLVIAEKSMNSRIRQRIDGEDVVQSVFRSFFHRTRNDEYRIDGESEMWQLLVTITVNKARMKARYHSAEKRDARNEEGLLVENLCRMPDAGDAVALMDLLDAGLKGLTEQHVEVLRLRLEGHSRSDIAAHLGVSRQHVYRILSTLQQRFSGDS